MDQSISFLAEEGTVGCIELFGSINQEMFTQRRRLGGSQHTLFPAGYSIRLHFPVVFLNSFVIQSCYQFNCFLLITAPLSYGYHTSSFFFSCVQAFFPLYIYFQDEIFQPPSYIEASFPTLVPNHFISWHFHNLLLVLNPNVSFLTTHIHNPSFYNLLFGIIFLCQHFLGFSGGEKNFDSKPGMNSLAGYHFPLAINSFRQSRGLGCWP